MDFLRRFFPHLRKGTAERNLRRAFVVMCPRAQRQCAHHPMHKF